MKLLGLAFMIFLAPVTLPGLMGNALAHGHQHSHGHDDGHMASMEKTRQAIPEEYRVMERSPVAPTPDSLARGAELFKVNCTVCHGPKGFGDGPAAATLPTRPANFHDAHHSGFYNPGEKYWIIGHGLDSGMPPFGERLSPLQRWDLVNHVLNLPKEQLDDLFD